MLGRQTISLLSLHISYNALAFRYPNLKSVKELIYKRGYGKVNKQRIALTDNAIVEQVFFYFCRDWLIINCILSVFLLMPDFCFRLLVNMVLSALKILFMRSWLLGLTLRRLTTFSGHSNLRHHWVVWRRREITMLKEEMLETVKTTSMSLSEEWTRFCYLSIFGNLRFYCLKLQGRGIFWQCFVFFASTKFVAFFILVQYQACCLDIFVLKFILDQLWFIQVPP